MVTTPIPQSSTSSMVTAQARPTVVPPSDSVGSSQSSLTVQSVHARYNTANSKKQKASQNCPKKPFMLFYFFFRCSLFVCTLAPLSTNSLVSSPRPTYRSADAGADQSQGPGAPLSQARVPGSRQHQGPPHPYEGYYQVGCCTARSLTLFTTSRTKLYLVMGRKKVFYNILGDGF